MGYAALDEQTGQNVLTAITALRSEANAYLDGVRALAATTASRPLTEVVARVVRILAQTVEWCAATGRELHRRLLAVADPSTQGAISDAFPDPRARGVADGRVLASALARYCTGRLPVLAIDIPTSDPEYAAAVVSAVPPADLGRLAATTSAPALFALLGIAERGGTLPASYRAAVLTLPSPRLGPLLATTAFSTGFLVAASTALLVGKPTEPLTPEVAGARIEALRVAASDPVAARTLLSDPRAAERALRHAASWPGQDEGSRLVADEVVADLIRSGLAPEAGTSAQVSAAWRTVVRVVGREPDLVATHGAPARAVNRALVDAFAPYLPYVAWQGRTGRAGPAPGRRGAMVSGPPFVPGLPAREVARFLGRLAADRGALARLRGAVLRYARSLDLAGRLRLVPGTGDVVVPPALVRAGWLLSGAFGLLGYVAQDARLRFDTRVRLQGDLLGELLGVVFAPVERLPGGKLLLDLVVVPKLVDAFVRHQVEQGPLEGRNVLAGAAADCAAAVAGAIDVSAVPPGVRDATVAALRMVVLATVLGPVVRVTDPDYRL